MPPGNTDNGNVKIMPVEMSDYLQASDDLLCLSDCTLYS